MATYWGGEALTFDAGRKKCYPVAGGFHRLFGPMKYKAAGFAVISPMRMNWTARITTSPLYAASSWVFADEPVASSE
jgi:hypothetical protein